MTVPATNNRVSYSGNGSTTAFAFAYPFRATSDLVVTVRTTSTGAESLQTEGTHYTVTGTPTTDAGGYASGTVTFGTAPASGTQVHIDREPARTQTTDYIAGDGIPPSSIEGSLDRLTLLVQDLESRLARTLMQPRTAANRSLVLPEPSTVSSSKYLRTNSAGTGYELTGSAPPTFTVSVRDYGAAGDGATEDHVAIQAAIDAVSTAGGGVVFFRSGTYIIGATITLKSKVILQGEHYASTIIKAKASLNADMLKTLNYATLTGTNKYLISAGLQYGFGLRHLTLDGNKANQSSGNGLVCYGKKYFVEDVVIYNVKEIGWISEAWYTVGTSEFPNEPESIYRNVDVQYCGSHGIRYRGPTDAYWSAVFSHENTGWGIRFETDASTYNAASDVIHVHVYTNTAGGIYNSAKMRFGHVAVESNYGQGLVDASFASSYGYIESYINCRTTGTYQIELSGSAIEVGRIWNADGAEAVSGVLSSGNFNRINSGILNGDGSTGAGLTLSGAQCHANCTVYGYSGAGGIGVQFGYSGTPLTTSSFDLQIYNCKTAYTNASTGNRNDGRIGVSLTSGQSLVTTDFAANENVYVGTTDAASASVSQQTVPQGALASPGVAFSGDRDTGMYRPSANRVSLVAGGVEGVSAAASGATPQVGFLGTTPTSKASITGSRGANAALANLLTELAAKGLITDSTTA